VDIPPAIRERLQAQAQSSGKDIEFFVREPVEQKRARHQKTFAEILKPIHSAVEASGMSDQYVDVLLEGELKTSRAQRRRVTMLPRKRT
jgi:hypothetical protein